MGIMKIPFPALFLSCALLACSSQTLKTAAMLPVPLPAAVRLQRSLESRKIREAKSQAHFEFILGTRHFRVGSGTWKISEQSPGWNRMYGWGPVVWVTEGKSTRVLDLRAEFPSNLMGGVFQGNGRIFLFIENGIEGPGGVYHVWISEDSGEHWFAGADLLRPPGGFPPSSLENFYLRDAANGIAVFKLEAANLSAEARKSLSSGADAYYSVTTSDGGRSWNAGNAPAFSSLVHAEQERQP